MVITQAQAQSLSDITAFLPRDAVIVVQTHPTFNGVSVRMDDDTFDCVWLRTTVDATNSRYFRIKGDGSWSRI